jgi:hypothetical protein
MAIKPVVLTVDDDVPVLRAVERDLRKQYGQNYRKWGIYFTQVDPIYCGWDRQLLAKHFTIDLYGAGSTATACSARRRKSFPRLRDFRRLKRNVNSSR